jgi:GTP-binding protein HflX
VPSDEPSLFLQGQKALLAGVSLPGTPASETEEHLDELAELAVSAGCQVVDRQVQSLSSPHPATFLGSGKAKQLADRVDWDVLVFDHDLSPSQTQNLETLVDRPVVDRSALILQLFSQRARTREARTQVELAQLQYMLPRLTRYWSHLSRQAGGIGQRGGEGEKQIEIDRRIIRRRIARLERDLVGIAKTRETQRRGRREAFEVALAGYTNVGKSTLFNALTDAGTFVQDRLFATLDSKLRRAPLGDGYTAVFADTVGFVRKLPHHLVASFRSTLEEVRIADLVLHVVDASHARWEEQTEVGDVILADLEVDPARVLVVLNKIDRLGGEAPSGRGIPVSARTGEGLEELRAAIRARMPTPRWKELVPAYDDTTGEELP